MSEERVSLSLTDVEAEVSDLRAEAQKLLERADKLEELARMAREFSSPKKPLPKKPRPSKPKGQSIVNADPSKPYRGMGTKIAAITFLRREGKPLGISTIAEALIAGGKETQSDNFMRTVDNTLAAAAKKKNAEVVKIGKQWGLKEWNLPAGME